MGNRYQRAAGKSNVKFAGLGIAVTRCLWDETRP